MQAEWQFRQPAAPGAEDLAVQAGIAPLTARLLTQRGLRSAAEALAFLSPSLDNLQDPLALTGISAAQELLSKTIKQEEKIQICGDYDVDGVTASALLYLLFQKRGGNARVYLPNRFEDGYGLGSKAVEQAIAENVKVIITVDCGITAIDAVRQAREAGIEVIILDHHQLSDKGIPQATVIVHPGLNQDQEFQGLSAVGLAYKLAQAMLGAEAEEFLDLVVLGTVADVAPLCGENRNLVYYGLKQIVSQKNPGVKALAKYVDLVEGLSCRDLSFGLIPRLNACGRMLSADISFQLLTVANENQARLLAETVEEQNKKRQQVERKVLRQALAKTEAEVNFSRERIIVVWGEEWHPGVVGIVAARLVRQFYRPAIVIAVNQQGIGTGSARSIKGCNVYAALKGVEHLLLAFGGHAQAAGLTVKKELLNELRARINQVSFEQMTVSDLIQTHEVDIELESLSQLTIPFLQELTRMEPFGQGNPEPVFLSRKLRLKSPPEKYGRNMLRLWVTDANTVLEARWQNPPAIPWEALHEFDLLYTPRIKYLEGRAFPYLALRDLRL